MTTAYRLWPELRARQASIPTEQWSAALPGKARDSSFQNYLQSVDAYVRQNTYLLLRDDPGDFQIPLRFRLEGGSFLAGLAVADDSGFRVEQILGTLQNSTAGTCVVFEGSPGAGKSTLLRRIARDCWQNPRALGLHRPYIPIVVRLRWLAVSEGTIPDRLRTALEKEKTFYLAENLPPDFYTLWPKRKNGRWLLLLDGFDEVPAKLQDAFAGELRRFIDWILQQGHSIVLTSRPNSLSRDALANRCPTFSIQPFSEEQKFAFSTHYLGSEAAAFLKQYRQLSVDAIGDTPLLLAIAILVFKKRANGRLPLQRTALYSTFVTYSIDEAKIRGLDVDLGASNAKSTKVLSKILQRLALLMTEDPSSTAESALIPSLGPNSAEESEHIIRGLAQHSGVLQSAAGYYDWIHPTFREFLAACEITDDVSPSDSKAWDYARNWSKPAWHQVLIFMLQLWGDRKLAVSPLLQRISDMSEEGLFFVAWAVSRGIQVEPQLETSVAERLIALTRGLNRMSVQNFLLAFEVMARSPLRPLSRLQGNEFVVQELTKLVLDTRIQTWLRERIVGTLSTLHRVEGLLELARDPSQPAKLRIAICAAFVENDAYVQVEGLLGPLVRMKELDWRKREVLAVALAKHESPDEPAVLLLGLARDDGSESAIDALMEMGRLSGLVLLARDPNAKAEIRVHALNCLAHRADTADLVPFAVELVRAADRPEIAQRALNLLAQCQRSAELIGLAESPSVDQTLRGIALGLIRRISSSNESVALVSRLATETSEKPIVRIAAARVWAELGHADAASDVAFRIASDTSLEPKLRREAAAALAFCGRNSQAIEVLLTLTASSAVPEDERRLSASALADLGDNEKAAVALRKLSKDTNISAPERCRAAVSLGELGHRLEAGETLLSIAVETHGKASESWIPYLAIKSLAEFACGEQIRRLCSTFRLDDIEEKCVFEILSAKMRFEELQYILKTSDRDLTIQWRSIDALAMLGRNSESADVIERVARTSDSPGVGRKAIRSIPFVAASSEEAEKRLQKLLSDASRPVQFRLTASETLIESGAGKRIQETLTMIASASDQQGWARLRASQLLVLSGFPNEARNALLQLSEGKEQPGEPPVDKDSNLSSILYFDGPRVDRPCSVRMQAAIELASLGEVDIAAGELRKLGCDATQPMDDRENSGRELLRLGKTAEAKQVLWSIAETGDEGEVIQALRVLVTLYPEPTDFTKHLLSWLNDRGSPIQRREAGLIHMFDQRDIAGLERVASNSREDDSFRLSATVKLLRLGKVSENLMLLWFLLQHDDVPPKLVDEVVEELRSAKSFDELGSLASDEMICTSMRLASAHALIDLGYFTWAAFGLRGLLPRPLTESDLLAVIVGLEKCEDHTAIPQLMKLSKESTLSISEAAQKAAAHLSALRADRVFLFWALDASEEHYGSTLWADSIQIDSTAYHLARSFDYWKKNSSSEAEKYLSPSITPNSSDPFPIGVRGLLRTYRGEYTAALEDLNEGLRIAATSPLLLVGRGDTLYRLGRYQESLADYTNAIALGAIKSEVFAFRGATYLSLGDYEKALIDLNYALELAPGSNWALEKRGFVHESCKRYDPAIADYTQRLAHDDDSWSLAHRGYSYYKLGRPEEGLVDLSAALSISPEYVWALIKRADLYDDIGRYPDSLADFDAALRIEPDNIFALLFRGKLHLKCDRYDEAIADFDRVIANNVGEGRDVTISALTDRARAHRYKSQYVQSLSDFSQVLTLQPNHGSALAGRGETYRRMHLNREALADLNLALSSDPSYIGALRTRARVYRALGRYSDAMADLERVLAIDSEDAFSIVERSQIYFLMGQNDKAIEGLSQAVLQYPNFESSFSARADIYVDTGNYEEAVTDYNRALELSPRDSHSVGGRGWAYLLMNKYQDAVVDMTSAISLSSDPWWLYSRFVVQSLAGNEADAALDLKTALERVEAKYVEQPGDGLNALNRALYRLASGDIEKAEQAYKQATIEADDGLLVGAKRELLRLIVALPRYSAGTHSVRILDAALQQIRDQNAA